MAPVIEPVKTAPFYPGTSSHRESSIAHANEVSSKQNNMNQKLGGGKKQKNTTVKYIA